MKKLLSIITLFSIMFSFNASASSYCEVYKATINEQSHRQSQRYLTINSDLDRFMKCENGDFSPGGGSGSVARCECAVRRDIVDQNEIQNAVRNGMNGTAETIAKAVSNEINQKFNTQLEANKKANFDALARIKQDVLKLLNDIQEIFFE